MIENSPYLVRTTFDEIVEYLDEAELYEEYYISSQDKNELRENNEEPHEYYTIGKVHFDFQDLNSYSILIKRMDGSQVELKGIDILSNYNQEDADERIYGMKEFLLEYYEKNMTKNSTGDIYYFFKYED